MKRLFCLMAAFGPLFCYAQDWKLTVYSNLVTDLRQTASFRHFGVHEVNPIYRSVGERELPGVFALASVFAADYARKNPETWEWWGVAQFLTVLSNSKQIGHGHAVLSWRF